MASRSPKLRVAPPPRSSQEPVSEAAAPICRIPLTKGLFALVDESDFGIVSGRSWRAFRGHSTFYAVSGGSTARPDPFVRMHRLIAGARPGQLVDHANFDRLDNRRANLRIVTLSESSGHRRTHRRSKTGVLGVSRCAHGGWQARITVDRREQYLGFFRSLVAAAFAYNQAAIKLRGPLAVLNDLSLLVEEVS